MKRSTRDMTRDEMEAFLKMSSLEVYDAALKFYPGEVRRIVIVLVFNLLLLLGTTKPILASLHENKLDWWVWLDLLYLVASTAKIILSLPSSSKARQLCEEHDQLLEARKRLRM